MSGDGCRRFPTGWLCVPSCADPVHDEFLRQSPADTASTGTDVEALASEVCPCSDDPDGTHVPNLDAGCGWALALCRAVLASDWLAAHDAATAERVRRETAEGIAAAIEAEDANDAYGNACIKHAARIAREQAR